MNRNRKVFQDTVHGCIYVPEEYCDKIIDTAHFQRLRRIEQTSMRSLYPCAHHDRFIHSIGSFHLGQKAFQAVKHNSSNELSSINEKTWDDIQKTFEIACLLHDCGHAPFSHTFEKYFDMPPQLFDLIISTANNAHFSQDVTQQIDAKPHEIVSAVIVLTTYKDIIISLNVDPLIVARMILGCYYIYEPTDKELFINCFISLLKGKAIDIDRVDYITRDKWASGFSAIDINIDRLFSAACIKRNNEDYTLCFKKSAICEIQGVIDVRNYQLLWIHSHHKIQYDQFILEKAIEKLSLFENKESSLNKLFCIESINSQTIIGHHKIYLLCDDDLVHLLKETIKENDYANEWFSRDHKFKPVWKTFSEFNFIFNDMPSEFMEESGKLNELSELIIKDFLKKNNEEENSFLKLNIKPKIKNIEKNDVFITINEQIIDFSTLNIPRILYKIPVFFFYIFIPVKLIPKSHELIEALKGIR